MELLVGIGILIITWIYFQIIAERDKRFRKEIQQYNKNIKAEEKRRIREEKLKMMRVDHPKVIYISDYRQPTRICWYKIVWIYKTCVLLAVMALP